MVIFEVGDVENTSRGMAGAGHTKANVNSSRKSGKTVKYDAILSSILSRIAYVRRYKVSVYGCIRFSERKLMCSLQYRGMFGMCSTHPKHSTCVVTCGVALQHQGQPRQRHFVGFGSGRPP